MSISDSFIALGIQLKGNKASQKVKCPNCVAIGKTNINDTCLSIDLNTGLYNCFKCGYKGCVAEREKQQNYDMNIVYKTPTKQNMTALNEKALAYFESRSITQEVINNNKIVMTKDGNGIVFPYLRDGKLVNYKIRSLAEKKFYQAKEAEPIMYNLDRIKGEKEIIVCEGEFDSLSWEVAGHTNHTTVNQGAPNENDTNVDKKLECITNCYEVFEQAEVIYIAVDADNNGIRLQKELIRRFGAEKCKLVDFRGLKDANEYLMANGTFELNLLLKEAKDVKIEGVFTLQDNFASMMEGFDNWQKRGETTHIEAVDAAWKWRSGEVNLWTGYQNEGKSLFLNQLSVVKAYMDGDKFAVFSPENMPIDDFWNDLIEMFIGATTDPFYQQSQMSKGDYLEAMGFVDRHFFIVHPELDYKLETIFSRVRYLIRKQGIRHFIIDPYNTIEHLMHPGEREDLYISRFMSNLKRFSVENDISIHLVAHQLTARANDKDEGRYFKPDLNKIKGGGTFADKADNVLFVWRPNRAIDFRNNEVIFGSQKIKKQKLVARPCEVENITFEFKENRYYFNGVCAFSKVDRKRKQILEPNDLLKGISPFELLPQVSMTDAFGDFNEEENDAVPF